MWVVDFYIWHLSLTTKLSECIKCNMVILKKKKKKVIFSELWKVDLCTFGIKRSNKQLNLQIQLNLQKKKKKKKTAKRKQRQIIRQRPLSLNEF